jgi:hypothetical protein
VRDGARISVNPSYIPTQVMRVTRIPELLLATFLDRFQWFKFASSEAASVALFPRLSRALNATSVK